MGAVIAIATSNNAFRKKKFLSHLQFVTTQVGANHWPRFERKKKNNNRARLLVPMRYPKMNHLCADDVCDFPAAKAISQRQIMRVAQFN